MISLVVDDDPELRRVVSSMLAMGGHTVLTAGDGYEAIRILVERWIDLMITDIRMAGLSGIELARQARLMRPSLHVIFISGFDNLDPPRPLLRKPFRSRELFAAIAASGLGSTGPSPSA